MSTTARNHSPFVYCLMQVAYQLLGDGALYINSTFRGKQCQRMLITEWYNTMYDNWVWWIRFANITAPLWAREISPDGVWTMDFRVSNVTVNDTYKTISIYIEEWEHTVELQTSVNAMITTYDGAPGEESNYSKTYNVYAFPNGDIIIQYIDGYEIDARAVSSNEDASMHVIVTEKSLDGSKPNMQYELLWETTSGFHGYFATKNLMVVPQNKMIRSYNDIEVRNKDGYDVSYYTWCVGRPINTSYFKIMGRYQDGKYNNYDDITNTAVFSPPNGTVFDTPNDYTINITAYDLEGNEYTTSFTMETWYEIDSANVVYDNTESGLEATTLEGAIKECYTRLRDINTILYGYSRK